MITRSRGMGALLAMAAVAAMPSPASDGSLPMEIKAFFADDFGSPRIDWRDPTKGPRRKKARNTGRKKMAKQSRRKNR